jgi:hypothetical protein
VVNGSFFRRLTLRLATGTPQRAVPTIFFRQRHDPIHLKEFIQHQVRRQVTTFCRFGYENMATVTIARQIIRQNQFAPQIPLKSHKTMAAHHIQPMSDYRILMSFSR